METVSIKIALINYSLTVLNRTAHRYKTRHIHLFLRHFRATSAHKVVKMIQQILLLRVATNVKCFEICYECLTNFQFGPCLCECCVHLCGFIYRSVCIVVYMLYGEGKFVENWEKYDFYLFLGNVRKNRTETPPQKVKLISTDLFLT